ncbi:MAG: hypothetical protein IJ381_07745 [Clostridia bacterium]|nr:hypothetical protein [Clostridia bacterium]
MKKTCSVVFLLIVLLFFSSAALAETRALLIACSDFISQPDLGNSISGNLHMIGSALISADIPLGNLSIEDGTIGTFSAFESAVSDAFSDSQEDDLSLLYICTHGILSSSDDSEVYLLLGDGQAESPLSSRELYSVISRIPGEKLLILDACFSGALLGRGMPERITLPGAKVMEPISSSPFLADPTIHVLTSAGGSESAWYYDSESLKTGAVSYFASALSTGLGLYGSAEADLNGNEIVTLDELHRYLSIAVPSSSSQLLSSRADALELPVSQSASLSSPLTGFSFETSLLSTDDPTLYFSYTVTRENTGVQYRLVDYENGRWNWENARTFLDEGDTQDALLSRGRKSRALTLEEIAAQDSGYLMLQIFSVTEETVLLCSERLIALQPAQCSASLSVSCHDVYDSPGKQEMPVSVHLPVPAELTVSVFDDEGKLVRRLASSQLTRPSAKDEYLLYWDGRDNSGFPVPAGRYTITAEAVIGSQRKKAAANIIVRS